MDLKTSNIELAVILVHGKPSSSNFFGEYPDAFFVSAFFFGRVT
jgi:hypothetical protein